MTSSMTQISDEFNTSAKAYLNDQISVDLLMTKYSILMKYLVREQDEKKP